MKKSYMNKIIPLIFPILMAAVLIYSCDDSITGTELDNVKIPESNISYSKYIQPIFSYKCAISGCHDDVTQKGGVILTSYIYVNSYPLITPGNSTTSKLVWAIEGNGAQLMPPQAVVNPLTKAQITGIKTWIKEGAENN